MTETIASKEKRRLRNLRRRREKGMKERHVNHHIKYKEIHGEDEIIILTESEHRMLHNRLRREGKCKIPAKKLAQISMKARTRSDKYKQYIKHWSKNYRKIERQINFYQTLGKCVRLIESIHFNQNTGAIGIYVRFQGTNGQKLYEVLE